ncbi:MAG: ATP-binding protein [Sphingomonadaceae bacterium]|nr:ATP-binding protein [Sphingomonadaceae bacterium]
MAATDELGDFAPGPGVGDLRRARLALAEALAPSQPVTSAERFAGRADVLEALIAALEQARAHVVLYGERGIGKTSLVHVLAETAREARYLVLYGSCGAEARFDEMFRSFAQRIPLLYHADIPPTTDEEAHRQTFADLVGPGALDPRELADLFGRIVGTRVILILDEYDRVLDVGFRRNVAELIKNLSDRAARVQLVLTGVAASLEELVGFAPSIRRNLIGLPVGPMDEAGMAEILDRAEAATGLTFGPDARAAILRMAAGSPYVVRLLGSRAAGLALDAERLVVTREDVRAGAEAVLSEWNAGLPRAVQRLLDRPEVQRALPRLIAAARASGTPDGSFSADDVAAEAGTSDTAGLAAELEAFASRIPLFERVETDTGPRYRFRTQGLAQLLGLSAALARLEAHR